MKKQGKEPQKEEIRYNPSENKEAGSAFKEGEYTDAKKCSSAAYGAEKNRSSASSDTRRISCKTHSSRLVTIEILI